MTGVRQQRERMTKKTENDFEQNICGIQANADGKRQVEVRRRVAVACRDDRGRAS